MAIETAEQWDDEWWRIWQDAKQCHQGEVAAKHADHEMSVRHGLRPPEHPLRLVQVARLFDLPVELLEAPPVAEVARIHAEAAAAEIERYRQERSSWLRRAMDRAFG